MKSLLFTLLLLVATDFDCRAEPLERSHFHRAAKQYRIIGGEKLEEGSAPYSVSIQPLDSSIHLCGGAIIDRQWIVTVAHCVFNWKASEIIVVTGTNQWSKSGVRHYVDKIFTHCKYDHQDIHDDIALLQLKTPIIYNNKTEPVSLPTEQIKSDAGEIYAILTGWGDTEYEFEPKDQYKITLKYLPRKKCSEMMKSDAHLDVGQMCTYTRWGEGTCRGDSGGPLVSNGRLIGVVNGGEPCAIGYPDVYANIFFYTDWIRRTMSSSL